MAHTYKGNLGAGRSFVELEECEKEREQLTVAVQSAHERIIDLEEALARNGVDLCEASTEIKPCPFCGWAPEVGIFHKDATISVACHNPHCQCKPEASYVGAWNTRPIEHDLHTRLVTAEDERDKLQSIIDMIPLDEISIILITNHTQSHQYPEIVVNAWLSAMRLRKK